MDPPSDACPRTPVLRRNTRHAPAGAAGWRVLRPCWLSGLHRTAERGGPPGQPRTGGAPEPPLGRLVNERRTAAGARSPSGFLLLSGPQAAYSSRLALVEAQKTLDLQYYAIHADTSTERLLLSVVAAARREVRVRVLLDDFHSTERDAQVMRLAFVPNIEMRMFNPCRASAAQAWAVCSACWATSSACSNACTTSSSLPTMPWVSPGGRNLGDAYFGNADTGNFVDLDVLAAGLVVQELSRSFDSYWNNQRAYPVQSLVTRRNSTRCAAAFRQRMPPRQPPRKHPPLQNAQARTKAPPPNAPTSGTSNPWTGPGRLRLGTRRSTGGSASQNTH